MSPYEQLFTFLSGNPQVVRLLIASGAKLEAFDVHFGPPLHIACAKEHLNCVKELLTAGVLKVQCMVVLFPTESAAANQSCQRVRGGFILDHRAEADSCSLMLTAFNLCMSLD